MATICDNCQEEYNRHKYHKTAEATVRLSAVTDLSINLEILGAVDICGECMQRAADTFEAEAKNIFSRFIELHRNPTDKRREEHPENFLNTDDPSLEE